MRTVWLAFFLLLTLSPGCRKVARATSEPGAPQQVAQPLAAPTSNWDAAYPEGWPVAGLTVPQGSDPVPHPTRTWDWVKSNGEHSVLYPYEPKEGELPFDTDLWEVTFESELAWDKLAAHVDAQLHAEGFWLAQAYPVSEHEFGYDTKGEHCRWGTRVYFSGDGLTTACLTWLDHDLIGDDEVDDPEVKDRADLVFKGYLLGIARLSQVWPEMLREQVAWRAEQERRGDIPPGYMAPRGSVAAVTDKYAELAPLIANAKPAPPDGWPVPELKLPPAATQRLLGGECLNVLERRQHTDQEHWEFHEVEAGRMPYKHSEDQKYTHITSYAETFSRMPEDPEPAGNWMVAFWERDAKETMRDLDRQLRRYGFRTKDNLDALGYTGGSRTESRVITYDGSDRRTRVTVEHYQLKQDSIFPWPTFRRWPGGMWPAMESINVWVNRSEEKYRKPLIGD